MENKKLNFDLSFLDNNSADMHNEQFFETNMHNETIVNVQPNIKTDVGTTEIEIKEQDTSEKDENNKINKPPVLSGEKSSINIKYFFIGFAIILAFLAIIFVVDYREKEAARLAEVISHQYDKTYNYLLENNPQYMISIYELSDLTKKSIEELDNEMHNQLKEEKEKYTDELVDNMIEDKNDDKLKEHCLKSYYRNDSTEFNSVINSKLKEKKLQKVKQLVDEWKNNSSDFETNKNKYLKTLFANNINELNKALDLELGYKQFTLVKKALPSSGVIKYYTNDEPIAPFEIKTSVNDYYNDTTTTTHYYIKLVDYYNENNTLVTIFVRSGESVKVDIPIGDYKLKYATGETWYGEKDLFGHKTSYSKSEQQLNFSNSGYMVYGHTITLYKVQNGNLSTENINASDF